jgi:hypothetical protein
MVAPIRDYGHANFGSSAGARNAIAFANPLTPGGMNPKGIDIPTFGWVLLFVVAGFLVYKYGLKGR